jgi:hypothetical protein
MEVSQYIHEKFQPWNQMLNTHTNLLVGVMEILNIEKMKFFQRLMEV